MMMYAADEMSVDGLVRILELKGVRRVDQGVLIEVLEAKLGGVQGGKRTIAGHGGGTLPNLSKDQGGSSFKSFFRKSRK
jgi:hypothetical protein